MIKQKKDKGEADIEKQVLALKSSELDSVQKLIKDLATLTAAVVDKGEDLSPEAARELASKISDVKFAEAESGEKLPPNLQSVIEQAQELSAKQSVRS